MSKIGIFYGSSTGNTESTAKYIKKELSKDADIYNISDVEAAKTLDYDFLIFGVSTWGEGDLQDDWESLLPKLKKLDLSGKTVALFGLGDQDGYPDNFQNAMGTVYSAVVKAGAKVVGEWPAEGYDFSESTAVVDGKFVGLALDEDNQAELSNERIALWLGQIGKFL